MSLKTSNTIKLTKPRKHLSRLKILLICLGSLIAVLTGEIILNTQNPYALRDWWLMLGYNPPASIVSLANQDTMTPYARDLFYVNKPQLDLKPQFFKQCPNKVSYSYVIGCYHQGDNGIFLLNVQDPSLTGIVQVTAAYEMLHAGYARLSTSQQKKIDNIMWSFYSSHNLGSEISSQMASYKASEPGEESDELYSVLATEVTSLPLSLNREYARYFYNRQKIVDLYLGYQSKFTARNTLIKQDQAILKTLKKQINSSQTNLDRLRQELTYLQQTMDNLKNQQNITAYNSYTSVYNSKVNEYNSLLVAVKSQINQYNQTVNYIDHLATEEQQLVNAINSRP